MTGHWEKLARNRREALTTVTTVLAVVPDTSLVKNFTDYGGRVRFSAGTYLARFYGIIGNCTEGEAQAVKAWLKKATQEVRGEA